MPKPGHRGVSSPPSSRKPRHPLENSSSPVSTESVWRRSWGKSATKFW